VDVWSIGKEEINLTCIGHGDEVDGVGVVDFYVHDLAVLDLIDIVYCDGDGRLLYVHESGI